MPNLLPLLNDLTEMELKLIADAIYDPDKHDYTRPIEIGFLDCRHVIAALRRFYMVYGTEAARDLADRLRRECCNLKRPIP